MPNYFTPTINDVVAKGQHFLCEFVELKRNGYHHYTRALNDLTVGFWRPWLDESDKAVDQLADNMKLAIKFK
jgi:hypothetical protein